MLTKKLFAYIRMSRLSNLPTVGSNALAAMVFVGGVPSFSLYFYTFAILTLYYVGGMFLNDACDAAIDRKERPERPIPQEIISRKEAFFVASLFLVGANLFLAWLCQERVFSFAPMLWGGLLTLSIVIYDIVHKSFSGSPWIMASCRFWVYLLSAAIVTSANFTAVLFPAFLLGGYIIGLTYFARQENHTHLLSSWPLIFLLLPCGYAFFQAHDLGSVSWAIFFTLWVISVVFAAAQKKISVKILVGFLLAGISLWDGVVMGISGGDLSWWALLAFFMTLLGHRFLPGT